MIGKKSTGTVELDPVVFEAPIREHLFYDEVRRQLAARHRGTHSTKNRSAVSGGGSKPWRQKGTGRARQGSIRSPQWAGGGVVFGPVPRSYAHALPKKVRRGALRSALSLRKGEGKLFVVDAFDVEDGRTKTAAGVLADLGFSREESVLVVLAERTPGAERAVRNLAWADTIQAAGLNTYDTLRHKNVLVTEAALALIHGRLGDAKGDAS